MPSRRPDSCIRTQASRVEKDKWLMGGAPAQPQTKNSIHGLILLFMLISHRKDISVPIVETGCSESVSEQIVTLSV